MKFGWRLAALGTVFLGMFSILFLRLWVVQIAAGSFYEEEALGQQLQPTRTIAARGEIRDRNDLLLAGSQIVPFLAVDRGELTVEQEEALFQQLSALLGQLPIEIRSKFESASSGATISFGAITPDQALWVATHQSDFPGTSIEDTPVRVYPQDSLMSHVVGYVGLPGANDLAADEKLDRNTVIGKSGVERSYERYLTGEPGTELFKIDPQGRVTGREGELPAAQGGTVFLTLDGELNRSLEFALRQGMQLSIDLEEGDPSVAAGVVMDITDGSILAMASVPDYEPQVFVGGLSQDDYDALKESNAFINLATQGLYPPGSTFKPITWATALNEGIYPRGVESDTGTIECTGELDLRVDDNQGGQLAFTDAGHGTTDLHEALGGSCNVYFWQVALSIWRDFEGTDKEDILQQWARSLGLGSPVGVDLPFEKGGRIPDRALFEEWAASEDAELLLSPDRFTEQLWRGGDVMNVAIGQGETLATPLQMAVAYAALVNGGTVWQPHVVDRVADIDGNVIVDLGRTVARRISLSENHTRLLLEDLTRVTNTGSARDAFRVLENPWNVGGKTGTAERLASEYDTAWFVGVAPIDQPKYVVAVLVVDGGIAGRVAAPVVRYMFQHLLPGETPTPIRPGGPTLPADLIEQAPEEVDE